ncbi:UDP-2,4-diacetamido-2,4,6-trideoxy-beta-L-altropyranose hydrolase [Bacillus salitolerans]|uniref:UDP-2,4-diacetamido-2,4, 6-trideoxy-beta-L-altropyranose hydrolase n=1 Tax=Bacillus salitolerans TaxID=1437434 RepID=A0ABW4LRK4_9BACI
MKIVIRVDSSVSLGTGHVMRCLTLANYLKKEGIFSLFLCKDEPGNLISEIRMKGFEVLVLNYQGEFNQNSDALETLNYLEKLNVNMIIVDHYGIDRTWESQIRRSVQKIFIIDDLANRQHDCDYLLDQNYYKHYFTRYQLLVPKDCRLLLGPSHLILREEFYKLEHRDRRNSLQRLLIFYGGSDPTNETLKAINAITLIDLEKIVVDVVTGSANLNNEIIKQRCLDKGFNYHCQIDYLATLMNNADLSLGAGGVTMWERCYIGLPSIVTIVADNQINSTNDVEEYGAIINLGYYLHVTEKVILNQVLNVISQPNSLRKYSRKAKELIRINKQEKHPVVQAIMEGIS